MKKLASVLVVLGAAAGLSGCLQAPVMPPIGLIYTGYTAPLDYDQEESMVGSKDGMSETASVLGLVAWGDGSIKTAAQNGGINKIHGADYEYFNVLGIYQRYRTVVHGE
ncbi:hypothetical protein BH09SUM1_BH09SUM1_06120 [soil metagenome]